MKKTAILLALLVALLPNISKAAEIEFDHGDWKSILAKAGKENKLVFIDAYTVWCGPCKWMVANTFNNPEVAEFFNKNFINAKIDMEKGEGIEIAKMYGINSYPTLLFVDSQGSLVHRDAGSKDPQEFIAFGKKVLAPDFISIDNLKTRFDKGERNRGFLKDYLVRLSPSAPDYATAFHEFEPGMKNEGLLDQNSWELFSSQWDRQENEYTSYFLNNVPAFTAKFGEETVGKKTLYLFNMMINAAAYHDDTLAFQKILKYADASGLSNAKALGINMEIHWYERHHDLSKMIDAANRLFALPGSKDANTRNTIAWIIYESSDDKAQLKTALRWVEEGLKMEKEEGTEYAMLDTKAMLQFKLGMKKKGNETAQLAIESAKKSGEDYSATLEEMKKYE